MSLKEKVVRFFRRTMSDEEWLAEERKRVKDVWWSNYNSRDLCFYYSRYFDEWWDPDRFDWENKSWALSDYCSKHFDKWWDPDKFNQSTFNFLAQECSEHFDKWWDPAKFNWDYSWTLAAGCSSHFDKWWDPDKYDWVFFDNLESYCSSKFTDEQLKQLMMHRNAVARTFAKRELDRRKNGNC